MAKHRASYRRKRTKLLKGNIDEAIALGTLANNTLLADVFDETVNERTYAISMEATWSLRDLTPGEGAILFGVAHGDYSAAEIEAVIENAGSWNEGDLVSQEIARRKVRIIGQFEGQLGNEDFNDGVKLKTKLGWILNQGETLDVWAYNRSGAALTTGAFILLSGHIWLRPT